MVREGLRQPGAYKLLTLFIRLGHEVYVALMFHGLGLMPRGSDDSASSMGSIDSSRQEISI